MLHNNTIRLSPDWQSILMALGLLIMLGFLISIG